MLNIHAKMDRKSDDGSRFYQEISREYLLPDTLKTEELKSQIDFYRWWSILYATYFKISHLINFFFKVLCIEAPQPEAEKPQEIPIDRCELPKKEYIK